MTDFSTSTGVDHARTARLLRAHGITPTPQRIEIAQIILRVSQHLSAEQVIDALPSKRNVSKATVYNSLKLFAEQGLIRPVNVHSDRVIYDSNHRPHHHFYNIDTGELIDIEPERIQVSDLPEAPEGTVAEEVEVVIKLRSARSKQ